MAIKSNRIELCPGASCANPYNSENSLTPAQRAELKKLHRASLNIFDVWERLAHNQRRGVLMYVLEWIPNTEEVERVINGGMTVVHADRLRGEEYREFTADEILARGDGAFTACVNVVPSFEYYTREIMFEMVTEGQVVDSLWEVYG